jgi:hypothetical protein
MAKNTSDATLPNFVRAEVSAAEDDLTLMHDSLAGTRRMWQRSASYIRKWKDEDPAVYDIRRQIETYFEGVSRTLSAAVGMLFSKAPAMTWNASQEVMEPQLANIDAAGTAFNVFAKRFAYSALRDGIGILLVDHTSRREAVPAGTIVTRENDQRLGLRPTWAMYERGQAISWRTGKVDNQNVITQLVLAETAQVEDGMFGVRTSLRYRVLRIVGGVATWTLYEQLEKDAAKITDFRVIGSGVFRNRNGEVRTTLPIAIAYAGTTDAPMTSTIPLLGVAWANLAHWRAATNLTFYRDLCAFPQPKVKGSLMPDAQTGAPGQLRVGPMVAVQTAADGDFEWAELAGTSLDQLEKGVTEKLGQMSKLGLAFLQDDTRAAETAEAKRLDATAENSTLATAAQGLEDAYNLALEITAWYNGIAKADAPVCSVNRDYTSTAMDPATMTAYVSAVVSAGLPPRVLLEAWQAGGRLAPDADLDELEAQMAGGLAAAEEMKRLEAQNNPGLKIA